MTKKRVRFVSIASVLLALVIMSIVISIKLYISPEFVRLNSNYDRRTNLAIRRTVSEMLRLYYGGFDEERLEKILSEELFEDVLTEARFRRFRETEIFFLVDPNYMQTLNRIGENQLGEQLFRVRVEVEEGLFESRTIHHLVIEKRKDGTAVIVFIDYDR